MDTSTFHASEEELKRTLRGATAADLWQPIGLLSLYTAGIIGLAVLRFKKTAA